MEGGRGEKCLCERETRFGCLLLGPWQGTKHGARHVPCQGMEPETFLFAGRGPTYWATLARATFRCENSMGHCWQQHSTHLVRDSWVSGGQMEPRGREGSCPWQDKAAEDANVHFQPQDPVYPIHSPGTWPWSWKCPWKSSWSDSLSHTLGWLLQHPWYGAFRNEPRYPGLIRKPNTWPGAQCHLPVLQEFRSHLHLFATDSWWRRHAFGPVHGRAGSIIDCYQIVG